MTTFLVSGRIKRKKMVQTAGMYLIARRKKNRPTEGIKYRPKHNQYSTYALEDV
jgi:hypothetical protein